MVRHVFRVEQSGDNIPENGDRKGALISGLNMQVSLFVDQDSGCNQFLIRIRQKQTNLHTKLKHLDEAIAAL